MAQPVPQPEAPSPWQLAVRPLPEPLRPWVRSAMGYAERRAGPAVQRQLPTSKIVVIVEMGPPIRLTDPFREDARFPGGFVAGLGEFATETAHDGFQRGIQLDLTPVGARALFGVPMHELAGQVVALPDLLPRADRSLAESLDDLRDWSARLDVVEKLLARLLARIGPRSQMLRWACARLEATHGNFPMRALARELGYSEKQTTRLFRDQVGMAPKRYARLVRFEALVARLRSGSAASWSDLAQELGYYDQAHLAREVRDLAGATPTEVRAELAQLDPQLLRDDLG